MFVISPIVEGHGEVEAVPPLIHRIAASVMPALSFKVRPPIRVKADSFLADTDYFRKHVSLAARWPAGQGGFVLILLDCEDDCPATLGPSIRDQARAVRPDVDYVVTLAYREFETWFIEAAPSLRGVAGLPGQLATPGNPTSIRDAKGWLSQHMPHGYDPILHQTTMARCFDMHSARGNRSFDYFFRRVGEQIARSGSR
jgi:hypothetical protein